MSILVKGMKMPKDCQQCPCAYWVSHFKFLGCNVKPGKRYAMSDEKYRNSSTRPDWCPLVEVPTPHGRLIDANETYDKAAECVLECDDEQQRAWFIHGIGFIAYAPTIIEAEE